MNFAERRLLKEFRTTQQEAIDGFIGIITKIENLFPKVDGLVEILNQYQRLPDRWKELFRINFKRGDKGAQVVGIELYSNIAKHLGKCEPTPAFMWVALHRDNTYGMITNDAEQRARVQQHFDDHIAQKTLENWGFQPFIAAMINTLIIPAGQVAIEVLDDKRGELRLSYHGQQGWVGVAWDFTTPETDQAIFAEALARLAEGDANA